MSASDAARFFDTSGCLNLSRPTTGTPITAHQQHRQHERKRATTSSIPIRGQIKIDLYNFDHIDFADSKYVLTSPRSLEACARLNIKPVTLLPKKLADVQDDIGSEHVRLSTLADVRDQMEIERLAQLQRCREEREKIIREEATVNSSATKLVDPQPSYVNDGSAPRRYAQTKFTPSSSLLHGINEPTTISTVPTRSQSATAVKFSENGHTAHLPPRPTSSIRHNDNPVVASSILKSYVAQWPPSSLHDDDGNDLRASSSATLVDDVRRMNKNLQRISTSDRGAKQSKNQRYLNGLESVKEMLERRMTQSIPGNELDNSSIDKKQYELLLGHYDHELKIQKARENARRTEKEKEAERYESLLHDFLDHTMADERRQSELRRKVNRLHHSRQLYETLQAKNHEQQLTEEQQRRLELLNAIKRKDRRTQHFVKDKHETVNLSRSLAKSSQDLREYLRENNETFDQMAKKAELTSSVLVKKSQPANRRHLQSSLRA